MLGSPSLQIRLSWDTDMDMDLYVEEPLGNVIYYANPISNDGGQLDRDDLYGFGPENIFWEVSASDGTYKVSVQDYDESPKLQNWVVTINASGGSKTFSGTLQNGENKEVTQFSLSGGQISF